MSAGEPDPDLRMHWRLRPDIQIFLQEDHSAVLKDPLTGRYTLLVEHELAALRILEKSIRLSDWHQRVLALFPGSGIARSDLTHFLTRLRQQHVLQSASTGSMLLTRPDTTDSLLTALQKVLGSCFRIRIPVARPTEQPEELRTC